MRFFTKYLLLLVGVTASQFSLAQENPLERRLTLKVENVRLDDALYIIGQTGGFNFCYNSNLIDKDSLVSIDGVEVLTSEMLSNLLEDDLELMAVGNHIVIRKKVVPVQGSELVGQVTISGFIIDDWSGERMNGVTVFEDYQRQSLQTDGNGKFSISVPKSIRSIALNLSHPAYRDTSFVIVPKSSKRVIVGMSPKAIIEEIPQNQPVLRVPVSRDSTDNSQLLEPLEEIQVFENQRKVPAQISFVPLVGSNGISRIGTDNYVSLNILGGMTKGTKGLEIGGALNINRKQMYGIQISGAANIVGTDMYGWQNTAGYNYVGRDAIGFQIGGVANHVRRNFEGWQFSMGANITEGQMDGLQMATLFNYARKVNGVQFGVINISDTINGLAIGIINISRNGYLRVELQGSEVLHNNIRFKSGTNGFYTILEGGVRWSNTGFAGYGVGGGVGSRVVYAKKRMFTEFEADFLWMNEDRAPDFSLNLINRFTVTLGVRLGGPVELQVGPTFVYHHSTVKNPDGTYNSELGLNPFYRNERTEIDLLQQMWVGVKGGIQFDLNWRKPKKKVE